MNPDMKQIRPSVRPHDAVPNSDLNIRGGRGGPVIQTLR